MCLKSTKNSVYKIDIAKIINADINDVVKIYQPKAQFSCRPLKFRPQQLHPDYMGKHLTSESSTNSQGHYRLISDIVRIKGLSRSNKFLKH